MNRAACLIRHTLQLSCVLTVLVCQTGRLPADDGFDRQAVQIREQLTLRTGESLEGEILSEEKVEGRETVVFRTTAGEVLKLDSARLIDRIRRLDAIDTRYNEVIETLPDTAQAHHDMVTWCEEQDDGRVKFRDQLLFHRQRIMELDPNDTAVRKQLELKFIEEEGRWVNERQYWKSMGYFKRGTSWVPIMQQDLSAQVEQQNEIEGKRKTAFGLWRRNLTRMSAAEAQQQLFAICDEAMMPILFAEAAEEQDPRIRALYIEAFGRVPSSTSINALVFFVIEDASDRALDLLQQEGFDRNQAAASLAPFLASSTNAKVNRAAFAIGELGTTNTLLSLADALITEHVVAPADQPGRITQSFDKNGNLGNFGVGGNSKPVKIQIKNQPVLDALTRITEQDLGFSTAAWQQWYIQNYTYYDLPVRR